MIEENEAYRKIIECVEGGSDDEVEAKIQWYLMKAPESRVFGEVRREVVECGIRGAVEARRKGRGEEQGQRRHGEQGQSLEQEQGQQGKQVRFGPEEQLGEMRAESTNDLKETDGVTEVRTGRGRVGLVHGGA